MKQFLFLCLSCVFLLSASPSYAQNNGITLAQTNVQLSRVLDLIESQSDYTFLYNKQFIDVERKVTINVRKASITTVLNLLFGKTTVKYTIDGKQIVLSENSAKQESATPVKGVQGRVSDAVTGEPLVGASIIVAGTTRGTVSDTKGLFFVETTDPVDLTISYFGYQTQTASAAVGANLELALKENLTQLDDVVVVGYGTVARKNITTAIAQVKTDKITKAANSNISQLLMGRAAGLQATVNSSQPDGNVSISIRGGGNPIYVVDGVVMPAGTIGLNSGSTGLPNNINRAGLAGLNPADIESVEILKDASAAIYGIGAADGVILITTKKGKDGAPRISYDGSYTLVRNYEYLDVLNAQEYMNMANIYSKESYLYNNKQYPYGGLAYDGRWLPLFSPTEIAEAKTNDWVGQILRNGYMTNHNITISGGSKHVDYYLSGSVFDQKGTVSNSGMTKYTFRGNIGVKVLPFFKLTTAFNTNHNLYDNAMVGDDVGNRGNTAGGSLSSALLYPTYLPTHQPDGSYTIFTSVPNPVSYDDILDKTKQQGNLLNFTADIDILKNMLSAKGVYGINMESMRRSTYIPSDIYFDRMMKSRGNINSERRQSQTFEVMLQFKKNFGNIVDLGALIGMGRYLEDYEGYGVSYENTNDIINEHDISSASGAIRPTSYTGKNEKRSQFAKLDISILDRYIIAATLRRDGTDKFFPTKKYAYFPSVSGAWKISSEKFMEDVTWIDLLKLRASWGRTGQDNLGTTLYGTFAASKFKIVFDSGASYYIPFLIQGMNYPDVTWQKTTMKNVGLDFHLFKNRLSGSIDVYRNDITDLLGWSSTSPLAIFSSRPINGAHFYRRGWEFSLNTENIKTKNFLWTTSITFSQVRQYWKERMPNHDYQTYHIRENEPMSALYYYKVDGYINMDRSNMPDSQKSLQPSAQMPGVPILNDKNGDGVIDTKDIYMRDASPDLYVGFGNTFTYKNFDLDVFMYGQFGAYKYNMAYAASQAGPLSSAPAFNSNKYAYLLWNSQINPEGTRPGLASGKMGALPGGAITNAEFEDASFVRVRNITFGYTFDKKVLGAVGRYISSIRLYFDVQNPFVFTKYNGFDPEVYTGVNESRGQFPQIRSYSFGAKINF